MSDNTAVTKDTANVAKIFEPFLENNLNSASEFGQEATTLLISERL